MPHRKLQKAVEADPHWQAETQATTKLGHRKPSRTHFEPKHPAVYHPPSWKPRSHPLDILTNTPRLQSGKASNIPASLLKTLAEGGFPPEAWLDLHGYHEGDAWLKTMNWLHQAYDEDIRCVVIITGKGRGHGPNGDMGLIKSQIPTWLAAHPRVQAFHTALPHEGGQGAIYVYLQRHRV
ncbi:MAG: Smr/MutS family protein [Alphaproteobacteria bacterium]